VFDARGYDVGIGRYQQLLGSLDRQAVGLAESARNDRFFDLTGVRYLLSAQPLTGAGLRLAYDSEVRVYERPTALPRAYLASTYSVIPDAQSELGALDQPDVATGQRVLLEEQPDLPAGTSEATAGTADILTSGAGGVSVESQATRPALLVLSDAFYPGWMVTVDGRPAHLYRANYAFRAVVVPSGQHVVTFTFRPGSLYLGGAVSLATLTGLAAAAVWLAFKDRIPHSAAGALRNQSQP
jgi:hypothetical protein